MATHLINRIILIDQDLCDNQLFIESLQQNFNVSVEFQVDPELYDENTQDVIYVSSRFEGALFDRLIVDKKSVISDIIVQDCIQNKTSLPLPKYPLFNWYMKDFVICFSINDKKKTGIINKYLNLIRFMGGQSRRDMKSGKSFERTHLIVESTTNCPSYRVAVIYGIPILYKEWIDFLWDQRRTDHFVSSDPRHFTNYRVKPFLKLKIALLNFPPQEYEKLTQTIVDNDGEVVSVNDKGCTHLVINDSKTSNYYEMLDDSNYIPEYVITEKWLLASLEGHNRDEEELHKLKVPRSEANNLPNTPSKDDSIAHQTLNSILLSPNFDNSIDDSTTIVDKSELKKQAITQELYETERNYVSILQDIIKLFRDPLRNHQLPGQFPNEIELKTIFGNLPPIITVHEKILAELEPVVKNAKTDVGRIFQKHSQEFLTVYPQYVNYYENTKEMIELCTEKYPKFSSFLKACQTLPECRKQKFQELLINPIQRLPRIEMYLRALLNKTEKSHSEYKLLNEALDTIIAVNSKINQEKKKTEGQMEMFDLLNDIEDVPATLLSANRHFIIKCDVKLLIPNDTPNTVQVFNNYLFSLLLFTDMLLLCKKRTVKRTNSLRDRTTTITSTVMKKSKKSYKYIETVDLSQIKTIHPEFEDCESFPDWENAFCFIAYPQAASNPFRTFPFVVKDMETKKQRFMEDLIRLTENSLDNEEMRDLILCKGLFKSVDFLHSKMIARNLNRSKYVFMRTKEKINRTFSVRRSPATLLSSISMENLNTNNMLSSPSTNRLSRVFTNFNFLTPKEHDSPHIRNPRKLGSINDLSTPEEETDGNFSLPTTPAPRKKKYQESNS